MGNESSSKQNNDQPSDLRKEKPENEYTREPWKDMGDFKLESTTEEQLKKELQEFKTDQEVTDARLLFLGTVGAGKSSFINSIASIDKGRMAQVVSVGTAGKSLTTKLEEYIPKNITKHVILSDTMGIEATEKEGFNVQDIVYLVNGNLPLQYQFNPRCPVNPKTCANFKENPDECDKSRCVAFVVDVQVVLEENIPAETGRKISQLREKLHELDVATVILLTHIDTICADLAETFRSVKVGKAVKMAKEIFGIPEIYIFPVKNYSKEGSLDPVKNTLLLSALRQMMFYAADRLEMSSHHSKRPNNIETEEPKDEVTELTEAIKQMPVKSEMRDKDFPGSLELGQKVSARVKRPNDRSETWQDGHVKEIYWEVGILDPMPTADSDSFIKLLRAWLPKGVELKNLDLTSEMDRHTFVLCQNVSSLSKDIDIVRKDRSKVMFIVIHMRREDQLPHRESMQVLQENVHYQDIKHVIDMAFTRERGIYESHMNSRAREKVLKYLQAELPGSL